MLVIINYQTDNEKNTPRFSISLIFIPETFSL